MVFAAAALLMLARPTRAEPIEYIRKPVRGIPVLGAVKVGKTG